VVQDKRRISRQVWRRKNHTRLAKNFRKMFFEFINSFMSNKPCFNPPHMQDFMNPDDDVYRALTNHASSPCDAHEIIEVFNNDAVERDASYLFATQDVIFHYA
jgi:hypothetical protein